jgi:hypothetical protein
MTNVTFVEANRENQQVLNIFVRVAEIGIKFYGAPIIC